MKPYTWFNYLVCLGLLLSLTIFSIYLIPLPISSVKSFSNPSTQELRGVWLTNVASGVLFTPGGVSRSLKRLAQLNFNTVYPVVWNRGYTFYPSDIAKQVTGSSQEPFLKLMRGDSDVLAKIVQQGHREGLSIIPWFEYGLIAPANSELAKRHSSWLTQSRDDSQSKAIEKQVWLNPFHPEVQEFIKELIVEVVTHYDVDGIQLDDHFGMPVALGYDPFTVELYQKQHQGRKPPDNPANPEWMSWRAEKITNFMGDMVKAVKAVKPNVKISLSPNSQRFSYKNYLQDWQTWVQRGLIDELVLQVYRNDLKSFREELSQPSIRIARSQIPVSIGIFTGNVKSPVKFTQIKQQVELVRDRNFNGVSFFYWESLWGYITPESPRQRRQGFKALFSEPALRPNIAQIHKIDNDRF